jgi:hypothetical protein
MTSQSGLNLLSNYCNMLLDLSSSHDPMMAAISGDAQARLKGSRYVERLEKSRNAMEWSSTGRDGLSNLYGCLLEKAPTKPRPASAAVLHAACSHRREAIQHLTHDRIGTARQNRFGSTPPSSCARLSTRCHGVPGRVLTMRLTNSVLSGGHHAVQQKG